MTIIVNRKKLRKNADLANREKALSDLLQSRGIVEDDKNLQSLSMEFGEASEGCRIIVRGEEHAAKL